MPSENRRKRIERRRIERAMRSPKKAKFFLAMQKQEENIRQEFFEQMAKESATTGGS